MIWRGSNEIPEGGGPPRGENPGPESEAVGSRVESVLDAAERAASGIRQDAEEWARQYMEETRRKADEMATQRVQELSQLTDSLMNRARSVAKQSDDLISALDDAARNLLTTGGSGGSAPPTASLPSSPPASAPPISSPETAAPPPAAPPPAAPPAGRQPPEPAPPSAAPAEPAPPPSAPAPSGRNDSGVSEGARLLATQMAVAGSTRDEIAWRLREEFAIHDSSAILDEIGL
jgi:vacuolar-type H+-ATPase subunit H